MRRQMQFLCRVGFGSIGIAPDVICGAANLAGRRRPLPSKLVELNNARLIILDLIPSAGTLILSPFCVSGKQKVGAAKTGEEKKSME